jgi:hypothetical protein
MTLAVFYLGTARGLIGAGLREISSAGFLYLAVLVRDRFSWTRHPSRAQRSNSFPRGFL